VVTKLVASSRTDSEKPAAGATPIIPSKDTIVPSRKPRPPIDMGRMLTRNAAGKMTRRLKNPTSMRSARAARKADITRPNCSRKERRKVQGRTWPSANRSKRA